jgi:hypothetical protein
MFFILFTSILYFVLESEQGIAPCGGERCGCIAVYTSFRTVEQAEKAFPVVEYSDFFDAFVKHTE